MSETSNGVRCTCGAGHATFGACIRAKGIRIAYCQSANNFDYSRAKAVEHELAAYKSARDQGVQPAGTKLSQTRAALDNSDVIGAAFDASIMELS